MLRLIALSSLSPYLSQLSSFLHLSLSLSLSQLYRPNFLVSLNHFSLTLPLPTSILSLRIRFLESSRSLKHFLALQSYYCLCFFDILISFCLLCC